MIYMQKLKLQILQFLYMCFIERGIFMIFYVDE